MLSKLQLSNLPTELLLLLAGDLSIRDISSLSRSSHQLHWHLFYLLFDSAIAERSNSRPIEQCIVDLFFHAVKRDSANIIQYLIYSTYRINLNGYEVYLRYSSAIEDKLIYLDRSNPNICTAPGNPPRAVPPAVASKS